jgi:hypothetical protein
VRTAYLAVAPLPPRPQKTGKSDPVRSSMNAIGAAFAADPVRPSGTVGGDHRMSRVQPLGKSVAGKGGVGSVRVLWKVDTTDTSPGAKGGRLTDYSPVIGMLARAGVPHKVSQIEGRPGNPVVIAFDVARGQEKRVQPIVRVLSGLKGSQNLGTFPATEPLVNPSLLPKPESGAGAIRTATGIVGVLGALGLFLGYRLLAG